MAERRFTIVIYVAIATAAAATFGVYRVLDKTRQESKIPVRTVVVAARDLPEGTRIEQGMVSAKDWPAATVPEGAFSHPDSLVGRVTRVPVFTGEPMVPGRLAPAGTAGGLEVKIGVGKRAMAIRINDVAGIAGLIQPNSRVDVLVSLRDDIAQGKQVAKLFMENMRVLSVGTQVERGADGQAIQATTATLEVTPQEAERLMIASSSGSIQLVLRGYGDPDSVKTKGAMSGDVIASLGQVVAPTPAPTPAPRPRAAAPRPQPAAPTPAAPVVVQRPAPPPPDSITVQVFRGDRLSQQKFQKSDSAKTP
jgi:pilus assembly protein CpaB